ncbi:nuclear-pore anchor-like [Magnolia sinica]|uniref:nuclear-pore anchor-like n=1 Tax=Magnolia sinica TaxID=86752 RepID=UPI002659742E|nr:nuclear-pore anchor-like [Magnolia sinica]
MLGQKDIEIGEKNATFKSNLDKIGIGDLRKANEEILKLKDEAQAYKDHMLQYKEIAQVNEVSLKQMESAHERFKAEADKLKKSLEAEILSLRSMVSELESDVLLKTTEAAAAVAEKEEALSSALAEIKRLNEDNSGKIAQMVALEVQMSSLKEDLEEQQRWRTAQNNYQRQVYLQHLSPKS